MKLPERTEIENPEFWLNINPTATITDNPFKNSNTHYAVSSKYTNTAENRIREEGYTEAKDLIDDSDLECLRNIVINLVKRNIRPTYALLYDEFYHVLERLDNVLDPILGKGYQFVPNEFEVYHIENKDGILGTPPHRDSFGKINILNDEGRPKMVNIWFSLSNATTLNSCINVVPANLDPLFPTNRYGSVSGGKLVDNRHKVSLQDVRAVPTNAGTALIWNPALLHWGGRSSSRAASPRISFAAYFQRSDAGRLHPSTMNIPNPIPFLYRLYLVEKVWKDPTGCQLQHYISLHHT